MIIDKNDLIYRRATQNDISSLVDYRLKFLNELNEKNDGEKTFLLKEELQKYFAENIKRDEFVSWLAEYDGKIVATSGLILWKIAPRYDCLHGRYGYILNMYTLPEFRRNGISTELLKRLIVDAKLLKIDILNLHATKDGISIYRRFGFTEPIDPELELNLDNY